MAEYISVAVSMHESYRSGNCPDSRRQKLQAKCLIPKPPQVSFSEAAGLPIAGMTAYEGIVKRAKVHAGQRVFINGGSSAVGSIAIQIAKQRGAKVVSSCSSVKLEFVIGLGADVVCSWLLPSCLLSS